MAESPHITVKFRAFIEEFNTVWGSSLVDSQRKAMKRLITRMNRPTGPVRQRTRSRKWRAGTRKTKRYSRRG